MAGVHFNMDHFPCIGIPIMKTRWPYDVLSSYSESLHWSDGVFMLKQALTFNTLRPRQNDCRFADDIFKCIVLNENVWISIKISLKFVPYGSISYIPALVQIMAWRRPGDKPLFESMMVSLPTYICVTRPQWVNLTIKMGVNESYNFFSKLSVT